MSKIISVWSRKGGAGKSTLAINLAAIATQNGYKVLLLDSDKQGSCLWIATFGKLPFDVKNTLPAEHDYSLIIQDCAPNLDNVPLGQVVVVPFCASSLDIGSVRKFIPMLKEKGKRVLEVISKVNWQRKEPKSFALQKQKGGAYVIKDRAVYLNAGNDSTTIFDKAMNKAYKVNEARVEVSTIFNKALEG